MDGSLITSAPATASGAADVAPNSPADATTRSKRRPIRFGWLGLVEIIVILGLWQLLVSTGAVQAQFISSPSAVGQRLIQAFVTQRFIYPDLLVSVKEIIFGMLLGIAVGLTVGVLMGRVNIINRILDPIIAFLYATPVVALIPLLIIWLGIGAAPKIALVFSGVVFVVIVNTEAGIRSVDATLVEMARSFNASRSDLLRSVLIPGAIPFVLAGFRLAIGRALIMMMVGEMYGASQGLGFFITSAGSMYQTTDVIMGVIILASAAVLLTRLLRLAEARVSHWRS